MSRVTRCLRQRERQQERSMSGDATLPYGGMTRIRFEGYLSPASACGMPRPGRTPNVCANAT